MKNLSSKNDEAFKRQMNSFKSESKPKTHLIWSQIEFIKNFSKSSKQVNQTMSRLKQRIINESISFNLLPTDVRGEDDETDASSTAKPRRKQAKA